jgi:hypothetical protein
MQHGSSNYGGWAHFEEKFIEVHFRKAIVPEVSGRFPVANGKGRLRFGPVGNRE